MNKIISKEGKEKKRKNEGRREETRKTKHIEKTRERTRGNKKRNAHPLSQQLKGSPLPCSMAAVTLRQKGTLMCTSEFVLSNVTLNASYHQRNLKKNNKEVYI